MGFFDKIAKAANFVFDTMHEAQYSNHVVTRPVYFSDVSYNSIKNDIQEKIDGKSLLIKRETSQGWQPVGLVRSLTDTKIHYSPSRENHCSLDSVEITKDHTGKIVARAKFDNAINIRRV